MNQFQNTYGQPQGQPYGYSAPNQGYYPQQGAMYPNLAKPKMTQPLTAEDLKTIRGTSGGFNLKVTEEEKKKAMCTHKKPDGSGFAIIELPNGMHKCTECETVFQLVDANDEYVTGLTEAFINVLETIKTNYLDMPEEYAKGFFPILPVLKKVPEFFQKANENLAKYNSSNMYQPSNNAFSFGMLNALTGPAPVYGYNQPGQPMYGQPMNYPGQQMAYPQPPVGYPAGVSQQMGQPMMYPGPGGVAPQYANAPQQYAPNPFANNGGGGYYAPILEQPQQVQQPLATQQTAPQVGVNPTPTKTI